MIDDVPASTATTREIYDQRYSGDYMDTDGYTVWAHGDLRTRQVLETLRFAPIQPRQVLDYGCGVGSWLKLLIRVFPDAEVSGVDISEVAIGKAKSRYSKCRFASFEGAIAPFADGEFDLVFSYHVLEHVDNVEASIRDICRMVRSGGYAVIIFPCANENSFISHTMQLMKDSWTPTAEDRPIMFFEGAAGHVRRMTSRDTIAVFEKNGAQAVGQFFSGHFFGAVDWLCRGGNRGLIRDVFAGRPPVGRLAALRLALMKFMLLAINRVVSCKSLDLTKKRNPAKQSAAFLIKPIARLVDYLLVLASTLEWRYFKERINGDAQYLVFRKS
jgi:SAM-dependent methyltransferase